jgi:hypothetical protein
MTSFRRIGHNSAPKTGRIIGQYLWDSTPLGERLVSRNQIVGQRTFGSVSSGVRLLALPQAHVPET